MNIEHLNLIQKQQLIVLLKGRYKFDFIAKTPVVKSIKQLNFFLKNRDKLTSEQFEAISAFEEGFQTSEESSIIEKIHSGGAVDEAELHIVNDLIPQLDKITIRKPAQNYEVKDDEPLAQVLAFYEDVLKRHENGENFEWEKPWLSNSVFAHPVNLSGRAYNGQNVDVLTAVQKLQGYSVPVWLTRKNLEALGIENTSDIAPSAGVVFAKSMFKHTSDEKHPLIEKTDYEALSDNEKQNFKSLIIRSIYPVWHPDTIEHLLTADAKNRMFTKNAYFSLHQRLKDENGFAERFYSERANAAIAALNEAASSLGVEITTHNEQCFYRPSADIIAMVNRKMFVSDVAYAGTLAHELVHATGHQSRLSRPGITVGKTNKHTYGFEELVAETGANNFLLRFNLPSALDNESAGYIVGWLKALTGSKQKKYGLFDAAVRQGDQAAEYIQKSTSIKPENVFQYISDEEHSIELETLQMLKVANTWKDLICEGDFETAADVRKDLYARYTQLESQLDKDSLADLDFKHNLSEILAYEHKAVQDYERHHRPAKVVQSIKQTQTFKQKI